MVLCQGLTLTFSVFLAFSNKNASPERVKFEIGLMNNYDVLVVGAGPSGSMLSYYLGLAGLNVLLTDKQVLPRYKACGGGITRRAAKLIPFDIDSIVEDYSYRAFVSWRGEPLYSGVSKYPIISTVTREKFDNFLTCQAQSTGVHVLDNTKVMDIECKKTKSIVSTSGGTFHTSIVVGADGVNSKVAKALGLYIKPLYNIAYVAEVYPENITQLNQYKNEVYFDLNAIPEGYGWVFPKKDHLSVGLFSSIKMARYIRKYFEEYLRTKKINDLYRVKRNGAHLIPAGPGSSNVLGNVHGCVIGDAAGFADPITGEGIYYALREAQVASAIIKQRPSSLLQYSDTVKSEFMEEIRAAEKMAMVLYRFPKISKYILKKLPDHANNHIKIICGEQSYRDLYRQALSFKSIRKILGQ